MKPDLRIVGEEPSHKDDETHLPPPVCDPVDFGSSSPTYFADAIDEILDRMDELLDDMERKVRRIRG
jgi:hypothetical protein